MLQPENGIKVKKYCLDDGSDPVDDTVLPDLAPFLRALATQVRSSTCVVFLGFDVKKFVFVSPIYRGVPA